MPWGMYFSTPRYHLTYPMGLYIPSLVSQSHKHGLRYLYITMIGLLINYVSQGMELVPQFLQVVSVLGQIGRKPWTSISLS